jgi:hypothetical protein
MFPEDRRSAANAPKLTRLNDDARCIRQLQRASAGVASPQRDGNVDAVRNAHVASAPVMTTASAEAQSGTLTEATCTGHRNRSLAS